MHNLNKTNGPVANSPGSVSVTFVVAGNAVRKAGELTTVMRSWPRYFGVVICAPTDCRVGCAVWDTA